MIALSLGESTASASPKALRVHFYRSWSRRISLRHFLSLDHPIRALPNLLATPHIGYISRGLYARFYQDTVANICSWLDSQAAEAVGSLGKEKRNAVK